MSSRPHIHLDDVLGDRTGGKEGVKKLLGELRFLECSIESVGSRTIPSRKAVSKLSDLDYLVYHPDVNKVHEVLKSLTVGGSDVPEGEFTSYKSWQELGVDLTSPFRNWEVNFIVAKSKEFFDAFLKSNNLCVDMDIYRKEDRIEVFEYMGDPTKGNIDNFTRTLRKYGNGTKRKG